MLQPQSSSPAAAAAAAASQPDPAASSGASPTTPSDAATAGAGASDAAAASKLERPSWIFGDGQFFDEAKGVDVDKLGTTAKELFEFRDAKEKEIAARKADTPEKPDDYGVATPEGYKVPDGFEIDPKSPLWSTLREVAHKRGLTNAEFKETAAEFINAMAADQKAAMERFEAGKAERFEARKAELFKQLGDNGAQRTEAVKTWMRGFFGDHVGKQMENTLFTPDIVKAFESIQKTFTDQGIAGFSQGGRDSGRSDGKPDNWDSMSAVDKLVWQRAQGAQQRK
jgi:hypothetical protein